MLLLAMSEAAKTTISIIVIWVIAFPALVTGLIVAGLAQTRREYQENQEHRRRTPS